MIFLSVAAVFTVSALTWWKNTLGGGGSLETRDPAAMQTMFLELAGSDCDTKTKPETAASKIQITGPFCGAAAEKPALVRAEVMNQANRTVATVFAQKDTRQFSTEFIPLISGENPIRLRFTYAGGKVFEKSIAVTRAPQN